MSPETPADEPELIGGSDFWEAVERDQLTYNQLFLANHDQLDYVSMPEGLLARLAVDDEPYIATMALAELRRRDSSRLPEVAETILTRGVDGYNMCSALSDVDRDRALAHMERLLRLPEMCPQGEAHLLGGMVGHLLGDPPDEASEQRQRVEAALRRRVAAQPPSSREAMVTALEEHGHHPPDWLYGTPCS